MKLCRYNEDQLGVVIGDKIHDITPLQKDIRDKARYDLLADPVVAALATRRGEMEDAAKKSAGVAIDSVKLLPPVARYSKVMAAPTNYHAHIQEMAARQNTPPEAHRGIQQAGIFLKANSSIVGPSGNIKLRFPDRLNEHELELVMIIGKEGTNIKYDDALDYVAGYCMGIDMTVRGKEDRSFRKSIDGYSPVGPWLVTADEVADPDNVDLVLTVNGEERQKTNTSSLIYDCRKLIEFASSHYTLYPGDYYFTGTPQGVAPVQPGDVVVSSGAGIGDLTITAIAQE
ncbi:MAG: fumarylacetoacetate hydrolase family protein [Hyphomicrobiales bacterium]|nr:fumarylacetoacetate hydrolase family protein [Hyphomicrobiales bacterium]